MSKTSHFTLGDRHHMDKGKRAALIAALFFVCFTIFLTFGDNANEKVSSALRPLFRSDSDNIFDGRPLAVVIETDETPNLVPLMLHFSAVLGPSWTVLLFTTEANWSSPSSPAFQRARESGHIAVRYLPPDVTFTSSGDVSRFLTSPWLWEQVQSANRVLLWQTDSVICSRAERAVEGFFDYDFVGAPIAPHLGNGYNGGLSLRNPKLFLEVTRTSSFEDSGEEFEDQWFYQELAKRADMGVTLPSPETAMAFSVESIWYDSPIGYHQPERWQPDRMEEIEDRCPEVKMLIGRRAT